MSYEELSNYDLLGFGLNIKANLMHVQYEHNKEHAWLFLSDNFHSTLTCVYINLNFICYWLHIYHSDMSESLKEDNCPVLLLFNPCFLPSVTLILCQLWTPARNFQWASRNKMFAKWNWLKSSANSSACIKLYIDWW